MPEQRDEKVPFECGPRCDHGDAPHLYLNAIDPDRCAACAAWPSLPCAQHRERAQVALIHLNREEPPAQHALYQDVDPDGDYYDGPRLRPDKEES